MSMAQVSESLPGKQTRGRWEGAEMAQVSSKSAGMLSARFTQAPAARSLPLPLRSKKMGLRPAERKLLQAVADWGVIVGGSLPIMLQSERDYSQNAIVFSLIVMSMLWFFFANAFDAYRMPVLQSMSRSIYAAAKVFLVSGIVYLLAASFVGGVLPMIRPRIRETLMALMLIWLLLGLRALFAYVLTHAPLRRRVVVVGANHSGYEMVEALAQYGGASYEFMGYCDDAPTVSDEVAAQMGDIASSEDLLALNEEVGVD